MEGIVPSEFQIPLVFVVGLLGFLLVLALSSFSVQKLPSKKMESNTSSSLEKTTTGSTQTSARPNRKTRKED
ncbi:hypothetical protein ACA910_001742 [Epithemia clementina (nom. ined.)]